MRTATRILVVASLLLGSLSGCADSHPESGSEPRPAMAGSYASRPGEPAIDMITNSGDYPERRHAVDLADMALTERCMREAGIAWTGGVDEPNPEAREGGSLTLDYIRRHGYGLSDEESPEPTPESTPADGRLRLTLLGPPDALARLEGPGGVVHWYPRSGCAARAHVAVYRDLDTWARTFYFPQETNLVLHDRAMADPRYAAVLDRWSGCMAQHGHSYRSPTDIVTRLTEEYRNDHQPLAQRRAKEVALALQDVECNKEVRLSATALALRREYASQLDPQQGRELNRLAARFAESERRSAALAAPAP